MKNTEALRETLGDFARDVRVNLSNVLAEEGAPGLAPKQIWSVALACAYALGDEALKLAIKGDAQEVLEEKEIQACKTAATLMAMNNVYYRFVHLAENPEFSAMPAKLRMQGIATHGTDKITFELMSLAVSAVNACGMCIQSHIKQLKLHSVSNEAIQSSIRIASVLSSAVTAKFSQ